MHSLCQVVTVQMANSKKDANKLRADILKAWQVKGQTTLKKAAGNVPKSNASGKKEPNTTLGKKKAVKNTSGKKKEHKSNKNDPPPPLPHPPGKVPPPPPSSHCPPGLEYLTQIDQLVVVQEVDQLQVFAGWESKNRYSVKNALFQNVYYAVESNDMLTMNALGSQRPFEIVVLDNFSVPVIRTKRPFKYGSVILGCADRIEVTSGLGQFLGSIEEVWKCCSPKFAVRDKKDRLVFFLEGPSFRLRFIDAEFVLLTEDGVKVGSVTRHFPGLFKELYTNADVFGIKFPIDLHVDIKAVLLASSFLIDFMFYQEQTRNRQNNNNRMAHLGNAGNNVVSFNVGLRY